MLKYIIKRLGISVIVLFGVSVIIYSLVRMMPNDYVDNKWSSQLQNGAITYDDIDRFKELYGLAMPEAYYDIKITATYDDENGKTVDLTGVYTRKVREISYNNALLTDGDLKLFAEGAYTCGNHVLKIETENANIAKFYKNDDLTAPVLVCSNVTLSNADGKVSVDIKYNSATITVGTNYRLANAGQKFGSVLSGYFSWVGNLLKGDLGESFKHDKPVGTVIVENMWISFAIAIVATILQFLIAIPLGISSATHQYSVRDYAVTVFTMIGISLPTYFFGAIVIKAFAVDVKIFPPSGLIDSNATYAPTFAGFMQKIGDIASHLVLPIFVSVILSIGGLMRYTRTNTLEVLNSDYIRTARAKGLSEKTVIYKHAFRNTMIPIATLLAGILPSLFGGMMITEEVFCIDGIGRLAYQALLAGDVPFVMGYNMFLAVLTVIGTLFSDIMYSIVDPRVKLGG